MQDRKRAAKVQRFITPLVIGAVAGVLAMADSAEGKADSRGPRAARSVHLWFPAPEAVAFYNEVRVKESHPGSYFMACGFNGGYFGIQQLTGDTPRRVLFSVWDKHKGDDPSAVPEDRRVRPLFQGENVTVKRFGGEGTGGQSFFDFPWTIGETCRFLIIAQGRGNRTAFSGFFYRNDVQSWKHLATFETLDDKGVLTGLYSFIEDFRRDYRSVKEKRRAAFGAGWVMNADGAWRALGEARFTADGTPLDNINAGVEGGRFFLATGGETRQELTLRGSVALPETPAAMPALPLFQPEPHLVPHPAELSQGPGRFVLSPSTTITAQKGLKETAEHLANLLTPALGAAVSITTTATDGSSAPIVLKVSPSLANLGREAYELSVTEKGIHIRGASSAGVFYGIQTLRQLLPPEMYGETPLHGMTVAVPEVSIRDYPRFAWRGLMLDPCRHFLPVESVKKFIDLMALHKLNTLHWHLTEDQGWRIEIKQYPRLTEVGSLRAESPLKGNRNEGDGTPYGPFFYTQDEIREVLAYAAARSITVVPEIELPGHSRGALAAYPELGCTDGPYEVRTAWGVEKDIYCAGKEETFTFLENVLTEVLALFPSPFIHIGGDEAPKQRWKACPRCQARIQGEGLEDEHELQSYFIRRIETFLNEKGRRLIGWDEILEGGLAPNASVMSWRGEQGGITAARSGHDVVMSPTSHCYFDYAQSKASGEPEAIGGFLPLSKVYSYDPVPSVLTPEEGKHILGVQGNLWSEYLFEPSNVEYMAFPRACALAEVAWTPHAQMSYPDFQARLPQHLKRLDGLNVNYRPLTGDIEHGKSP